MKKNTLLLSIVVSTGLILTACFGTNEELAPGVELYETGTEESLVDARIFFMEYLAENPDDGDAEKYIEKIDEKYIEVGKNEVDKLFKEGKIERAYEIMQNLSVLAPNDASIKEQIEFNKFANYLEDIFKDTFEAYSLWDEKSSEGILGKLTTYQMIEHSKNTLSQVSSIRKVVEDQSLQLTNSSFIEINSTLFDYLNAVESSFSRIATGNPDMIQPFDIHDRTSIFNPENFNRTFSKIKQMTDGYVSEVDMDGDPVRNIENTLFFNYEDILKRQKEEAAIQLQDEEEEKAAILKQQEEAKKNDENNTSNSDETVTDENEK
jgi:hypothetical protein